MAATRATTLLLLAWACCGAAGQAGQAAAPGPGPVPIVFPPAGLQGPASVTRPDSLNAGGPLSVRVEPRRPLGRATAALRGVASRLQRLVGAADGAGNLLMSPLSVAAALGQLLLGARGETRVLLADLLDAPGPTGNVPKVSLGGEVLIPDLEYHQQFKALLELLATDEAPASSVELRVASAFFAQRGLPLRTDFQHALHDLYQADVRPLDFRERPVESAALVNEWARRASRGRIPTVLAQPLPTSTAALVASAVYFRGAWEWPFDPELTLTGWFKLNAQRRVAAKFMRGHFSDVHYYDAPGLGYRLVVLPYKGGQTAMYVVLPDDKDADLRTFAASMSLDGMMAAARAARPQTLTLVLPRMNIAGSFSLKEPLGNLRKTRRLPRSAPRPPTAQESLNHILTARSEPRARAVDSQAPPLSTPTTHPAESAVAPPSGAFAPSAGSTFSSEPAPFMHSSGTSEVSHPNSPPAQSPPFNNPPVPHGPSSSPPVPSAPFYFQELPKVPFNSPPVPGNPTPVAGSPSSSPSGQVPSSNFAVGQSPPANSPPLPIAPSNSPPNQALPSNAPPPPFNPSPSPPPTSLPSYVSPIDQSAHSSTPAPPPPPSSEGPTAGGGEAAVPTGAPGVEMQMAEADGGAAKPARPTKPPGPLNPLAVGAQGGYGLRPRPIPPGFDDIELDLTGASNATLRVSDALHHVWLEVTETGTEAVAITTTLVDYSGADQLVVVNRPFVVAIVHEPSEALLFWAAVNDPTGGAGIRTDVPQPTGVAPSPQAVARHGRA